MSNHTASTTHARLTRLGALAAASLLAWSCTKDVPNPAAPATRLDSKSEGDKVALCHKPSDGGNVISVSTNAMEAHLAHGDYVAGYRVNASGPSGDGRHFTRITDALDAARALRIARTEKTSASCQITITVAAGTYTGTFGKPSGTQEHFPLFIGVPRVSLVGAFTMAVDKDKRATGVSTGDTTTLASDVALTPAQAVVVVTDDANGYVGNDAVVEGFRFVSGLPDASTTVGGNGVGASRVRGLTVRGNLFGRNMQAAVDMRGSSATIERNYAQHISDACALCLSGPGDYVVSDNSITDIGFVSLFVSPVVVRANFPLGYNPSVVVPAYVAPASATYSATATNNDFSHNTRNLKGFGAGIRVVTFQKDADIPQAGTVSISGNTLVANNYAFILDANTPPTTPASSAKADVTMSKNIVGPSCKNNIFVSFTRISHTLGVPPSTEAFLNNSTYHMSLDKSTPVDKLWYVTPDGMGNSLVVNGAALTGTRTSPSDNPAGC